MARWFAQTLRASVILGVLWAGGAGGAGSAAGDAISAPGLHGVEAVPHVSIRPEVRLRKLHLVRPDLIPYPIAFEIVC